jgi:hypothetical protein
MLGFTARENMSQETRGRDSARTVKAIAAISMCVGVIFCFIWPGFGGLLLLGGFSCL